MTKSQKIKRGILPLIGVGIIFAMMWNLGMEELRLSLSNAKPELLVAGFLISFVSIYIFRIIRWLMLFNKAKPIEASKLMLIGLAINQIAPVGTGDLARAYIAKKRLNISVSETLAPTVVERILDMTLMVVASILFLFLRTTGDRYIWQIIIPIVLLITAYGLLLRPQFLNKLEWLLEKLKQTRFFSLYLSGIPSSLSLDTFRNALLEFRGGKTLLIPILLTLGAWGTGSLATYMLLLAFGVKIPILYVLGISCASWIIGTFSFLPGGLGAKEISFAFLLNTLGIPLTTGMWVSLLDRLMIYILLGGGALVSLLSFAKARQENLDD